MADKGYVKCYSITVSVPLRRPLAILHGRSERDWIQSLAKEKQGEEDPLTRMELAFLREVLIYAVICDGELEELSNVSGNVLLSIRFLENRNLMTFETIFKAVMEKHLQF